MIPTRAAIVLCFALSASAALDVREWEWAPAWSRTAGAVTTTPDASVSRDGVPATRIDHRAATDWSLHPAQRFDVKEGDILELGAWLKVGGPGRAELCVVTRDGQDRVLDWSYGGQTVEEARDGRLVSTRFVIPHGVATIHPRLIGYGTATVWMTGFRLLGKGNVAALRGDIAAEVVAGNDLIDVAFRTRDGLFAVTDKRTGRVWTQAAMDNRLLTVGAKVSRRAVRIDLLEVASGQTFAADVRVDGSRPEFTVEISGQGPLPSPVRFPQPFVTPTNTYLVVPMNEGISYPVDDASIEPFSLVAYGGHGICMAFCGATDGEAGQMAILETADDAAIRIDRHDGRLCIAPEWQAQKGLFGYARRIRYVFLDRGGHVAMCKRYRAYAQASGRLVTFTEKRRRNPDIDLLIGAVNTWCWEKDAGAIVREMQAAGIDRILWSGGGGAETVRALNEIPGVLTSRYDIYQDLMDPDIVSNKLHRAAGDWTQAAWPDDINRLEDGGWRRGWGVDAKDGTRYFCAVICDRQALPYAKARVPADLAARPFRARFIDTTTAAPWFECYDPRHPMTRTESREWKMKLLSYMSRDLRLVTGSETGHDAAVPYCDFFEGMLSLGPYRVPDAGRRMQDIWTNVPPLVAKFQLGHRYRLPLWELVYHDCLAAHWYWGDYNNKLPALWDRRDLFNALYGTAPMFMFNRSLWNEQKARFAASYRKIAPVARATGYSEMLDHRFLTADRAVQQTRFADGTTVTANFGGTPYHAADGADIPPLDVRVQK